MFTTNSFMKIINENNMIRIYYLLVLLNSDIYCAYNDMRAPIRANIVQKPPTSLVRLKPTHVEYICNNAQMECKLVPYNDTLFHKKYDTKILGTSNNTNHVPVKDDFQDELRPNKIKSKRAPYPMISVYKKKLDNTTLTPASMKTVYASVENTLKNNDMCKILLMLKEIQTQYATKDQKLAYLMKNIILNFFTINNITKIQCDVPKSVDMQAKGNLYPTNLVSTLELRETQRPAVLGNENIQTDINILNTITSTVTSLQSALQGNYGLQKYDYVNNLLPKQYLNNITPQVTHLPQPLQQTTKPRILFKKKYYTVTVTQNEMNTIKSYISEDSLTSEIDMMTKSFQYTRKPKYLPGNTRTAKLEYKTTTEIYTITPVEILRTPDTSTVEKISHPKVLISAGKIDLKKVLTPENRGKIVIDACESHMSPMYLNKKDRTKGENEISEQSKVSDSISIENNTEKCASRIIGQSSSQSSLETSLIDVSSECISKPTLLETVMSSTINSDTNSVSLVFSYSVLTVTQTVSPPASSSSLSGLSSLPKETTLYNTNTLSSNVSSHTNSTAFSEETVMEDAKPVTVQLDSDFLRYFISDMAKSQSEKSLSNLRGTIKSIMDENNEDSKKLVSSDSLYSSTDVNKFLPSTHSNITTEETENIQTSEMFGRLSSVHAYTDYLSIIFSSSYIPTIATTSNYDEKKVELKIKEDEVQCQHNESYYKDIIASLANIVDIERSENKSVLEEFRSQIREMNTKIVKPLTTDFINHENYTVVSTIFIPMKHDDLSQTTTAANIEPIDFPKLEHDMVTKMIPKSLAEEYHVLTSADPLEIKIYKQDLAALSTLSEDNNIVHPSIETIMSSSMDDILRKNIQELKLTILTEEPTLKETDTTISTNFVKKTEECKTKKISILPKNKFPITKKFKVGNNLELKLVISPHL